MKKTRLRFDLVLLGAPAAGKDTQAALLQRKFALKPVESGKYLRGLQRNKTKIGALVRETAALGLPAPVDLIKEFLTANIRLAPKDRDLIFVGNPRLKPEAEFLRKLFLANDRDFLVLYITLPAAEIWERSAKRMRGVEDSKYISRRIAWHKKQVGLTVKYFQKLNKLQVINGDQPVKKVNQDILKTINDYRKSRTTR
ncbi:MAG: nucleoside monophosphate kinase [Candidatus Doudnabacteria bacterium]|nr:nucleoside monophosphate kinase [Candidatus Doudnabacteria bacterium]